MILPNLVRNLARFIYLSILALSTLHDLAKSCKKIGKIHMLHMSILALSTLHELAKSCKKLYKNHNLAKMSCNVLPRSFKTFLLGGVSPTRNGCLAVIVNGWVKMANN